MKNRKQKTRGGPGGPGPPLGVENTPQGAKEARRRRGEAASGESRKDGA